MKSIATPPTDPDRISGAIVILRGQRVLLLVNGFGGTPLHELYLMVNSARRILNAAGLEVVRHLTGNYVTSLEMAGCSITVTTLDDELLALWDAPVHTAALRW
jgi:dihydroxyacetone kinase-like protein